MARVKAPALLIPWPFVHQGYDSATLGEAQAIASDTTQPLMLWVALRDLYAENWCSVEILTWPLPAGVGRDRYMVHHLPIEPFLRKVMRLWAAADKTVNIFNPKQRLPQEMLNAMAKLPGPDLVAAFAKLRDEGLLPPLPKLSRQTWPRDLPWDSARYCLLEWPA